MKPELWVIFLFGLAFLVTRVVLAIRFPVPTKDQEAVFRTVLSLSAAGIAAVIPGLLQLESEFAATTISSTGALGVFALVYLFNPASRHSLKKQVSSEGNPQIVDTDATAQIIQQLSMQVSELTKRMEEMELQLNASKEKTERHPLPPPPSGGRNLASKIVFGVMGVVLIVMLVLYAVFFPAPTEFQTIALRTIFALAGATLGATIPGMLEVKSGGSQLLLRVSTALLMFIIIYFFTPLAVTMK